MSGPDGRRMLLVTIATFNPTSLLGANLVETRSRPISLHNLDQMREETEP